jgi:hypothetical protein
LVHGEGDGADRCLASSLFLSGTSLGARRDAKQGRRETSLKSKDSLGNGESGRCVGIGNNEVFVARRWTQ